MDGSSRPIASGIPLVIDGQSVLLPPHRLEDFGAIENNLRAKLPNIIAMAAEAASADGISDAMADRIIGKAMAEARKMHSIPAEEVTAYMDSPEGTALGIWLCLERGYPGRFTLASINDCILKMAMEKQAEFTDLKRKRDMISGLPPEGNSTGPLDAAGSDSATPSQGALSGNQTGEK